MNENIQDAKLYGQAIKQRWPISEQFKEVIVRKLMKIVVSDESTAREITSASKVLMSAEQQNLQDEHRAVVQSEQHRYLEVAKQLGLEGYFRLTSEAPADSDSYGVNEPS